MFRFADGHRNVADRLVARVWRCDGGRIVSRALRLRDRHEDRLVQRGTFRRRITRYGRDETDHLARHDVERFIDGGNQGSQSIAQSSTYRLGLKSWIGEPS